MKKITLLFLILFTQLSFSQSKSRADRFFEKGDYINASKYYEESLKKHKTKKDIENIAVSYYHTFEYRKAAIYLKRLVNGNFEDNDKTYDNNFNFLLYQVLSTYGDYESALDYLQLYRENLSSSIDKELAIETIEEFKLKNPDYKIKKASFNSEASEFGATKLKDTVYFLSDKKSNKQPFSKTYKWTHKGFLDIYAVEVNDSLDTIGTIRKLPKSINTKLHEGNFCFTKDGKTLYISKNNTVDGKKVFDENSGNTVHIYKTTLDENGEWTELIKLPFNKNEYSYQHPSLNDKEDILYLSSNQKGGYGEFDIYYVKLTGTGTDDLINLGPTINTPHREQFPYITKEGNLFFSSNGHLGLGMLDIFVSENINNELSKPINLGRPINSRFDDFNLNYFNKLEGFFSSNRNKKSDEIYSFVQTGEIFIREYNNIFEIRDIDTDSLITNVDVELFDKNGATIYTNNLGDKAIFNKGLITGNYQLYASSENYEAKSTSFKTNESQDEKYVVYLSKTPPEPPVDPVVAIIEEKNIDANLENEDPERFALLIDTEGPPVVEKDGKLYFELPPIYFDFGKWEIRKDSKAVLNELAAKLDKYPKVHLKISSHTDNRGSARYNQILSERRAESTRNYLALEAYINARRLKFAGYGESEPIVDCPVLECTEEQHQLNRRSEFEILEY